ncbi:unnamed protein product [Hanseniaspora opuntiae]
MLQSTLYNLKDLTLEDVGFAASSRLGGAGSSALSSTDLKKMSMKKIKELLDSNNEVKLKNAMKAITYKMGTGMLTNEKAMGVYTYVLKNVNCQDLKTKKLCFNFLTTYMPLDEASAAYLAMNSVQQLLHNTNPHARELAMIVLSKFKSKATVPLILQFSKEMLRDFDPIDIITDANYEVVSSCVSLLKDLILKNNEMLTMLHGYYRRFVNDMDLFEDYCFDDLMTILSLYNSKYVPQHSEDYVLYIKALEKILIENPSSNKTFGALKALLVFRSTENKDIIVDAFLNLVALNHDFHDAYTLILEYILEVSSSSAYNLKKIFANHYKHFGLSSFRDTETIQILKLQIIVSNLDDLNVLEIFSLLQHYAKIVNFSPKVRATALYGIIECCKINNALNTKAMGWMVNFMKDSSCKKYPEVNNAAFSLLRVITSNNSVEDNLPAVYLLTKALLTKTDKDSKVFGDDLFPETKAGIVWLVADYSLLNLKLGSELLKKIMPTYAFESSPVKLQILTLAAKLYTNYKGSMDGTEPEDNIYKKMFNDVVFLSKFDSDYEIVDRGRYLSGLLNKCGKEISQLVLQAPKMVLNYMDLSESIPLHVSKSLKAIDFKGCQDKTNEREILAKVNNFEQKNVSISSKDYQNHNLIRDISSSTKGDSSGHTRLQRKDEFISVKNKKDYKLKTMEDFFADDNVYRAPQKKVVRKIVYQEETDSDDEEEDDDEEEEDDDDEEEDSE